ncbi:RNase adapter RapZ [Clostridium sp. 'deep sea']|uniref:RNase adapter RapZ n=1 Tax=Clostridium sp. 'deep sea' TaxID=2779445 RepID=UPI0018968F9A|nr:RNase adapter RapZ [Clostridium sp. 'deep sea']QOR34299.1 RNase adapter RapZ [Clostridium sp. 'deep sea']
MSNLQVLIITGMSGAGKSLALDFLEDRGYYCVDNLPPKLIPTFIDLCLGSDDLNKIALGIDIRGGRFFSDLDNALTAVKQKEVSYRIVYIEADNEVLVNRFKETRRLHPLNDQYNNLLDSINGERSVLLPLRLNADILINTTGLRPLQLKDKLFSYLDVYRSGKMMEISVMSFGFKNGIPLDADLVFDVRFLPNPYYDPMLRSRRGIERDVQEFIWKHPLAHEYLQKLTDLLLFSIPQYELEGKTQLTIAIGCTGGHHRSVAVADKLYNILLHKQYSVSVKHRDINVER